MSDPQFSNPDYLLRSDDSGDVWIVNDANVLKQRFLNALLTVPGERLMRPDFGSRFREVIFQLSDSEQDRFARSEARKVAQNVEGINFSSLNAERVDKHTKRYTIQFSSPYLSSEQSVTLTQANGTITTGF